MDSIEEAVDQLYKVHFGKLLSSVLSFSRDIDLETAEDIVQDSFAAALHNWKVDEIPANPPGWLYRVCRNKALNKLRDQKRMTGLHAGETIFEEAADPDAFILKDQSLLLLFACAHPDLAPKTQVVITLKYVVNLKVQAIANLFGMTIDGIDKLLVRAKQKIKNEKIFLKAPDRMELGARLPVVNKILYLIFNEGYKASWGKALIREELCEDALLMTKDLLDSGIGNEETPALYALMLFNAARFKARFGQHNELLDMEEQDRSIWDMNLVLLACRLLKQQGEISSSAYSLEASIACIHSTAKDFLSTDWPTVTNLYEQLLRISPNPFVELNYAIALYYSGKKEPALKCLHSLRQQAFFANYYLLHAALGKIYHAEGQDMLAKDFFLRAIDLTDSDHEKDFLHRMIKKLKTD